jgi:cytochrome c556
MVTTLMICSLWVLSGAHAAEMLAESGAVELSPDLLELLRAEMREISGGIQNVAVSVATGDWNSIRESSEKMRSSYIMQRKLTTAQASELEQALPGRFTELDMEFHQRAEKLAAAAAARDPELVVFHYARLLESCVRCHSAYAAKRFPGFASQTPQGHHH